MFYIKDTENNIVLADDNKQIIENTLILTPQYKDLPIMETLENETIVDFKLITIEEANITKANEIKNDLIEKVNYPLKEKVAYTGVLFDFENKELCFETNKESMSLINFTLTQIIAGTLKQVNNWKCRKVQEPHEPVNVNFTSQQFQQILQFAGVMVNKAFEVEKQINTQIESLTTEQLLNEQFIDSLKIQMEEAYKNIPIKMDNLFVSQLDKLKEGDK